jgi:YD repeat-containing protein
MTFAPMQGVYSHARNYESFIESGVDSRTGTYSCKIPFPELNANNLMGPVIKFGINYDPLARGENIGIGINWDLPLTRYDVNARMLKLSSGASYEAGNGPGEMRVYGSKVPDFRVEMLNWNNTIRVVYKTGVVEVLTEFEPNLFIVSQIISPEGRVVNITCKKSYGKIALSEISDSHRRLLSVEWGGRQWSSIIFWPDDADKKIVYELGNRSGWLNTVSLRTDTARDSKPIGSWRFTYRSISDHAVITRTQSPTGMAETINYQAAGLSLPHGAPVATVPVVESYIVDPRAGQPSIMRRYQYSSNNYLGVNGGNWRRGQETIYSATHTYEYTTTEILSGGREPSRTTRRTFNRFHLLLREVTAQSGKTVEREIKYPLRANTSFTSQPRNFQLPTQIDTTYYDATTAATAAAKRKETVVTEYDLAGNLIKQISASGITETYEYYPTGRSDGCPADPVRMVRWIKRKTITPAPQLASAPALSTHYRYVSLPNASPGRNGVFHALEQQSTFVGAERDPVTTSRFEYETGNSPFVGRLLRKTETVGGVNAVSSYTYELVNNQLLTRTTIEGKDNTRSTHVTHQDAVSGHEVRTIDSLGVVTAKEVDRLGRLTQETVSPGTDKEAKRLYGYGLCHATVDQLVHVVTHSNGARTRTQLDGLGREVQIERQDMDSANQPMRVIFHAKYDSFGQLIEETHTDWLEGKAYPLVTRYQYDGWGNRAASIRPDGVTVDEQQNPVSLTISTGRRGSGKTVQTQNLFGKDESVERFTSSGRFVSRTNYVYDGFGRCVQRSDAAGTTEFTYDFADRLLVTRLPDGTLIKKEYVDHSLEDNATRIWVDDYLAGERDYDGLDRVTRLTVGGRTETFSYEGAQPYAAKHTTASGRVTSYKYDAALNNQVLERRVESNLNLSATYRYDSVHARVIHAATPGSQQLSGYFPSGALKNEKVTIKKETGDAVYRASLNGLPLEHVDANKQKKTISYDDLLRVSKVVHGSIDVTYTYDPFGRVATKNTLDRQTGRNLAVEMRYDDFDRETNRTLTGPTGSPKSIAQAFDANDRLVWRRRMFDTLYSVTDSYGYDARGRLYYYRCEGRHRPFEHSGLRIDGQDFVYDALDNIREVTTWFRSGVNIATYHYENPDKTQLTRVTHSHPNYQSHAASFSYDQDGNQLNDERGRELIYDELGRLGSVREATV